MTIAIHFKILQRQLKFRNPNSILGLPENFRFTAEEHESAKKYIEGLIAQNIQFTYPCNENYPRQFSQMKEPPLFIEYQGQPFWKSYHCLSVVGARKIHSLTSAWLHEHLAVAIEDEQICIVSGGAFGVDQASHIVSLKSGVPTIAVMPSGLVAMYPPSLRQKLDSLSSGLVCYLSEFETHQVIQKHHFYARNRLIAALGDVLLVAQADIKSGSFLTVHHALEFGRSIITLPAHPQMIGFSGNLKLLREGAFLVSDSLDLLEFWRAEIMANQMLLTSH